MKNLTNPLNRHLKKSPKQTIPALSRVSILLLNFYQIYLSRIFGGNCRFYPSCSCYAKEAFNTHKPLEAFWLVLKRLSKCHPLGPRGFDPVPELKEKVS